MSLFEMRDFAPPKPAQAEGCMYCHENDGGAWPDRSFHEREHLPSVCGVCGETEPNRLLFEMNHGGPGWLSPVKCTALSLRLNHLTYDVLHGERPEDRDLVALELGWRIAPDGAQLPPADWDELHPRAAGSRIRCTSPTKRAVRVMPDGSPIDQWWKSHLTLRSTSVTTRVCAANRYGVAYCGTKRNAGISTNRAAVTCADCQAAIEADTSEGASRVVQPMPRPSTRDEYEAARSLMIDTLGRPLVLEYCPACAVDHFTVEPCASMVPCPTCGSTRTRCMRPSEHEAASWHTERINAFDELRDRLEAQGVAQVAKWGEGV